ncbi:MAG: DUF5615 family PIN-like protein [Chloroflexi bacterium]|nr:DUF5615 family PIN-like protein [Chloroflexota bacterium]MBI3761447.1 DUF5615 family PIN-like protein [Chloroflexota bacterium]
MNDSLALFIQLYTDEDVTTALAIQLRQRSFVARSAKEAEMTGQDDEAQLAYATSQNMAIMTSNEKDFALLAKNWAADERQHGGIIIAEKFSRRQFGELLRQTLRLLDAVSADEIRNAFLYLSQFR